MTLTWSAFLPSTVYDVGPVIGKGGFATVRSGKERASGATVALKILNPKALVFITACLVFGRRQSNTTFHALQISYESRPSTHVVP